ncbi:MAG: hypothetical protein ABJ004_17845 [Cyclobacteriaceae bacterium]
MIVLQGTANVGKSMTLASLGQQIQAKGGVTANNLNRKDYWAIFNYQGVKVGVQTYGDHVNVINQGIPKFLSNSCDIIAIAAKSSGATIDTLKQIADTNHYRVILTKPYEVRGGFNPISTGTIKDYCASHLLLMIDDIISGNL